MTIADDILTGPVTTLMRDVMKTYPKKSKKPLRSIRLFCGECMGMSRLTEKPAIPIDDIRGCTDPECPLFEFRFGKNPYLQKSNAEHLQEYQFKRASLA